MNLVLDAGVLSRLCHPNPQQATPIRERIEQRIASRVLMVGVFIPEIADYEVRRKLLHIGSRRSIEHLDRLGATFTYLPVDTPTMRHAAELWAEARRQGQSTAHDKSLDADVILAAQALSVDGTVATTNVRHLSRFVAVENWG